MPLPRVLRALPKVGTAAAPQCKQIEPCPPSAARLPQDQLATSPCSSITPRLGIAKAPWDPGPAGSLRVPTCQPCAPMAGNPSSHTLPGWGAGSDTAWDPAFLRSHNRRKWGTTGDPASPLSHVLGKAGLSVARVLRWAPRVRRRLMSPQALCPRYKSWPGWCTGTGSPQRLDIP